MINQATNSEWVIGNDAAIRISALASVLFSGCLRRIEARLGRSLPYQPWMTSPEISLKFIERPDSLPIVQTQGSLDFSKEYLGVIRRSLEWKGSSKHKEEHNLDIQHEVQKIQADRMLEFERAKDLVGSWFPWQKRVFDAVVRGIIPICDMATRRQNGDGFSDRHFIGYLFVSVEDTSSFPDIDLNVSLAHELAHQVLMIYEYGQDMLADYRGLVYSPIRRTERPAVGSFHATVALAYMLSAVAALLANEPTDERRFYLADLYRVYKNDLKIGIQAIEPYATSKYAAAILQNVKYFDSSLE